MEKFWSLGIKNLFKLTFSWFDMKQELGGNILLSGFNLDGEEMVVVRKMVGNYARKIRHVSNYDELKLTMKVHKKDKNEHFELHALVSFGGKEIIAKGEGLNPFTLIDNVMKKILQEVKDKIRK